MESNYKNVAKKYILYRDMRTRVRKNKSEFNKKIGEKLTASNVQNSNANMDEYSFGGRIGEAASELTKDYALDNLISKKARYNHINNICYIHDLNSYAVGLHNCLTVPIDDLLKNGFNTRQTDVRPANSINTAFQLVAVLFQIQSLQQFGGVSASHIDWSLVPYVRKSFSKHIKDGLRYIEGNNDEHYINSIPKELPFDDGEAKSHKRVYKYAYDMTVKETYQAVEGMLHNLNTLQSRSGNQLPFSSINYGTCTLEEGRLVTKAILESTIKGVGKLHRTSVFPCQIFKVKKGVNKEPNTPNYDLYKLALKCTSLRLYPNYANADWSTNQVSNDGSVDAEMSTMGKV
jgi:ribonucleoside-triphosphate reductase